jgi:hypothetical protein
MKNFGDIKMNGATKKSSPLLYESLVLGVLRNSLKIKKLFLKVLYLF